MAQVWQALNSLSRTMRDRGGVTDAQIRGIDATTGLKRAEFEIGRGLKADERADKLFGMQKESFDLGKPGRLLQKEKDTAALAEEQRLNELVPIPFEFVHPGQGAALLGELTADSDNPDNHTFSIKEQMVEGSGYDNERFRIKSDGSRVMVPRRKLEQDYGPALTAINAVRTDPAYHISGQIHSFNQKLSQLDPASPEYIQVKKDRDNLKAIIDDPVQMAGFYANQIMVGYEGIALALARKANPEMIRQLEKSIGRAEKKFEEYKGKVPTEESRLKLDDLRQKIEASKAAIEASKAKQKKYESETGKLKPSEQLAREKRNIENFSGKYRVVKDSISGFLTSPEYTESQRKAIEKEAEKKGVGVGFDEIINKGEKNYFSPNEPDTTTYRINSVWGLGESGNGSYGLTGPRQGLERPEQPAAQPGAQPAGVPAPPQGFVLDGADGNQPVAPAATPQTAGLGSSQAPPAASAEAIGQPIGTLSSGVEFGKGDRGYVVNRNGEWTVPTPQELKEIQIYVQQNPQGGGTPVDISLPPYAGPKGGYYNPANYQGLGR